MKKKSKRRFRGLRKLVAAARMPFEAMAVQGRFHRHGFNQPKRARRLPPGPEPEMDFRLGWDEISWEETDY